MMNKMSEKDDKDGDAGDEGDDHISDTQDADDEDVETESDEDDIYNDEEITDTAKGDAEKISEVKDDAENTELTLSSLAYLIVKETTDMEINSLLEVKIRSEESPSTATTTTLPPPSVSTTPSVPQQTTTSIPTQPITTDAPTITTVVSESSTLTAVELRVAKLEKDQFPESSKKQTPTIDLEQGSKKSASEILQIKREQAEKQQTPKFTIKSINKAALEEYDLKSAFYQSMHANKSFNINPANHRLYHALMEALIEDKNAMDKGVADTVKDHKRNHDDDEDDDDEDPPTRPNQGKKTKRRRTNESESSKKPSSTKETPKGKAPTKESKTSKSTSTKEPAEEPNAEVVMDDVGDDVARDDNQPQDTSEPKTRNTLNPDWFKQPPRPPTPDPEWNKRQAVLDQPEKPWFNQMVSTTKDPLTFNDLMATPIDFSKYVLNGLKIENLTQDILLGTAFNLLKGTCSSSIELEYNFQECFNALIDKLDWNNPKGDHYPFDLSKPLLLQGPPGHRTVAADYFFNNDLEYLKTFDPEVTYTSSITKIKAARYEIKGIKDMVSKFSKHNVYSTKVILGVKSVSVKKLHGYGHLEEIVVKTSDQQLYKFKECDFVDLHLNNIEDMLLLAVQHKLFHLKGSVIVDFIVALRMFTKSLILKRRVKDLQIGVESYQKKLYITKPQKTFLEIEFKEPYTPSYDPPGIVYEDLNKQKRVLRADELYKFSDGTLKSVRDEIHHKVLNFRLNYNTEMPKRKWTAVNQKRPGLMIELIDKQLREKEIIRNLERLVGARELEMDYKLMTRTV
ncbi:hypothetical protein Tco_0000325 [Tanacetum coccineum]